jgi:hypothetical protein
MQLGQINLQRHKYNYMLYISFFLGNWISFWYFPVGECLELIDGVQCMSLKLEISYILDKYYFVLMSL